MYLPAVSDDRIIFTTCNKSKFEILLNTVAKINVVNGMNMQKLIRILRAISLYRIRNYVMRI